MVVVDLDEGVELGLEFGNRSRGRLGAVPFLHGLLEAFDFAAGGGMVGSGVFLPDAEFHQFVLESVAGRSAAVGEAGGEHQAVVGQGGERDAVLGGNGLVVRIASDVEEPAMDLRVKRLDPSES